MLKELGFCSGIENYSRILEGRPPGSHPFTLLDYFPDDFVVFVDESRQTIPQLGGMYEGDRSRKQTLVDFGFRLPSAMDNRPLRFDEFLERVPQLVFVSATPGPFELRHSTRVAEQLVRPTGIVDPEVELRATRNQIDDLLAEIRRREEMGERVLVTTLTKKMSEDLTDYLLESGVKARYLHSEIDTLERIPIIRELRLGDYDVLVGVNLLREGLDMPEVSLVAILDADKEGFLRGRTSLIQTIGRAARNVNGKVLLYADKVTEAIREAMEETNRRRAVQLAHNEEHGITPETIRKGVSDIAEFLTLEAPHDTSSPWGSRRCSPRLSSCSSSFEQQMRFTRDSDLLAGYSAALSDYFRVAGGAWKPGRPPAGRPRRAASVPWFRRRRSSRSWASAPVPPPSQRGIGWQPASHRDHIRLDRRARCVALNGARTLATVRVAFPFRSGFQRDAGPRAVGVHRHPRARRARGRGVRPAVQSLVSPMGRGRGDGIRRRDRPRRTTSSPRTRDSRVARTQLGSRRLHLAAKQFLPAQQSSWRLPG